MNLSKQRLESFYSSGKSMKEIADFLNISVSKVVYWMNRYEIKRRTRSEATYVKRNPKGDPFKIKKLLNSNEQFLFGLGIGIYWGEGEKVSKHAIRVANTDPYVLKTFIKFLKIICGVKKEKFSYSIVCFNDSDPKEVVNFWCNLIGTRREKFGKIVQIPSQGKGIYKKKSLFGVCTVTVSNIKLKTWLMREIKKLKDDASIV